MFGLAFGTEAYLFSIHRYIAPCTSIKLVKSNTSILLDLRRRRLFHLEDDVALIADMIGFWQTIKEALSLYQARPLVKKIDLGSGQED